MGRTRIFGLVLLLVSLLSGSAQAARHGGSVLITFRPTTAIGVAQPKLVYPIDREPAVLVFEDGRPADQQGVLGTRTNDRDELFDIRISNDLRLVAENGLMRRATLWGLSVAPVRAELTLRVAITKARVVETYQAVGATYKSKAVLQGRLEDADGALLWEGEAAGETSRYGRPASPENASEVLSDALVEAFARLLSIPALQAAWVGEAPPSTEPEQGAVAAAEAAGRASAAKTPEALLEELLALEASNFSEETMLKFLAAQKLTRVLNAGDLVEWKAHGFSEVLLQQALALSVE